MMMHGARRGAVPLLALALAAGQADAARAQGQVVRLPERDRALAGAAPQVFSVGRADGAEHETFGNVSTVAFDAAENLYVLDRQARRVTVFDRTGRLVRQIGTPGQGPGELMVPVQMAIGGDGTVIVLDAGRPAYSLFRPDGTFVRNVPVGDAMPELAGSLAWHPRGGVVAMFRASMAGRQPGNATITETVQPLMLQPMAGGAPVRLFNVPRTTVTRQSSPAPGEVQVRVSPPPAFTPSVLFGTFPGGQTALSFTPGYTVRVLDENGQTLRYLQRPVRPRLATQRDRERARQQLRENLESGRGMIRITTGGGGGRAPRAMPSVEQRVAEMEFADTIPALQGLLVTPGGTLLVERTAEVVGERGPVDVLTADGQYRGTFTGPGLPDAVSRGGLAAYIDADEDGVQRVVVRRLPPAWR